MKADDVLEWQQNMTMVFTHPEGRKPVLMFESLEVLRDLVQAPSDQRQQRAQALYATIDSAQQLPAEFPVRAMEPKGYVDLKTQFSLLPILEFATVALDQYEARILKVAAAALTGERGASLLATAKPAAREQARLGNPRDTELLKKAEIDM